PARRGPSALDPVEALAPSGLGFGRRWVAWPARSVVRVSPDVRQIARYTLLARRDRLSTLGVRRSRRLGTDNEFERLRDYMEGDEPRPLDWRAPPRRRDFSTRAPQRTNTPPGVFPRALEWRIAA